MLPRRPHQSLRVGLASWPSQIPGVKPRPPRVRGVVLAVASPAFFYTTVVEDARRCFRATLGTIRRLWPPPQLCSVLVLARLRALASASGLWVHHLSGSMGDDVHAPFASLLQTGVLLPHPNLRKELPDFFNTEPDRSCTQCASGWTRPWADIGRLF